MMKNHKAKINGYQKGMMMMILMMGKGEIAILQSVTRKCKVNEIT